MRGLLPLILAPIAICELVSYEGRCEDEPCPGLSYTTFESNITNDGPLMWSLFPHETKIPKSQGMSQYDREFILSTPTTMNLSMARDFYGCGLLYNNVTSLLQVDANLTDYSNFSCDTLMSTTCQHDMRKQALDLFNVLIERDDFDCYLLHTDLDEQRIPPSCNLGERNWTSIGSPWIAGKIEYESLSVAQPPNTYSIVDNSTLHNDLWADFGGLVVSRESEEAKLFQTGVTPVMSLFFSPEKWNATLLPEPEVHLSCLKPIYTAEEEAKINGDMATIDMLSNAYFAAAVLLTCAATIL